MGRSHDTENLREQSKLRSVVHSSSLQILRLAQQCILYGFATRATQQCCTYSCIRKYQSEMHIRRNSQGSHVSLNGPKGFELLVTF